MKLDHHPGLQTDGQTDNAGDYAFSGFQKGQGAKRSV